MNLQETFNKVKKHLLKQNRRALIGLEPGQVIPDQCQYKTKEGLKCAIGCLLPKGHEGENFQGGMLALFDAFPILGAHLAPTEKHFKLLRHLQSVHDEFEPVKWIAELKSVAEKFDLKY